MRPATKPMLEATRAALLLFAVVVASACSLNPRPEDPGITGASTNPGPGNNGAGGFAASGSGGGGPLFGNSGQTGSPPPMSSPSDAGITRSHEAGEQVHPSDAAADAAPDAGDRDDAGDARD